MFLVFNEVRQALGGPKAGAKIVKGERRSKRKLAFFLIQPSRSLSSRSKVCERRAQKQEKACFLLDSAEPQPVFAGISAHAVRGRQHPGVRDGAPAYGGEAPTGTSRLTEVTGRLTGFTGRLTEITGRRPGKTGEPTRERNRSSATPDAQRRNGTKRPPHCRSACE